MSLVCKPIRTLDYSKYVSFSQMCFPHIKLTYPLFKWHFFTCPLGKRRTYILTDGASLGGLMSSLPIKIKYNDSILIGSLFTNGMIHPDYRGKDFFVKLVKYGMNAEYKKGSEMLLVVPSKVAYRSTLNSGFKFFASLDFLGKFSFKKKKHHCKKVNFFTSDFDILLQKISRQSSFMIYKDYAYLNWRYVQKPDNKYQIYCIMKGDELAGWIVISFFDEKKYLKTHIVDIQAIDFPAFKELIFCAESLAVGRHELNCWQIYNSQYQEWFQKMGFFPTTEKDVLLMATQNKMFNRLNLTNQYFCLGDNDVY